MEPYTETRKNQENEMEGKEGLKCPLCIKVKIITTKSCVCSIM